MGELVEGFAKDALRRIVACWAAGDVSLAERMHGQLDDLRQFYQRFNPTPGDRNVWSRWRGSASISRSSVSSGRARWSGSTVPTTSSSGTPSRRRSARAR